MRDRACPGSSSLGQWAGTVVTIAVTIAVLALHSTPPHARPLLRCDSLHAPFQGLLLLTSQDTSGKFYQCLLARKVNVNGNFSR